MIQKTLALGQTMLEIPRGNPSPAVWQKISDLARETSALSIRWAPAQGVIFPSPFAESPSPHSHFPAATRIISLVPSEEEIFQQFSETGRRHCRLAEKEGVVVNAEKDIRAFSTLVAETAKRDGFSTHSEGYFHKFFEHFGEQAILLVAQKEKEWMAAGIFLRFETEAIYYYGASCPNARNAPTLLQYAAMRWAKRSGATSFDLLGVSEDETNREDRLFGVSQFKRKFGGEKIFFPPERLLIVAPRRFWLWSLLKKIKKIFRT